jgi:hypothetical protein
MKTKKGPKRPHQLNVDMAKHETWKYLEALRREVAKGAAGQRVTASDIARTAIHKWCSELGLRPIQENL